MCVCDSVHSKRKGWNEIVRPAVVLYGIRRFFRREEEKGKLEGAPFMCGTCH